MRTSRVFFLIAIVSALLIVIQTVGSNGQNAAEKGLLDRVADLERRQVGLILPWGGAGECPDGFLICDGRELSAQDYPLLFKSIGYTWGKGAGNAFRIPDLRSTFLRGADDMGSGAANVTGNVKRTPGTLQDHAIQKREFEAEGRAQSVIRAAVDLGHLMGREYDKRDNGLWSNNTHRPKDANGGGPNGKYDAKQAQVFVKCEIKGDNTAEETRPRNHAVIFLIRAK